MTWQIHTGDCRDVLATLDAGSIHTCVTSPPYFGLRDYGHDGQIGLEPTPDQFVAALVSVFREVRRVLRDDGTVWLNLGDSYAGSWAGNAMRPEGGKQREGGPGFQPLDERVPARSGYIPPGSKAKDLIGIPWLVAFALRADGWYLRSEIIWHKPNPMPESVTDRPTKAHEQIFLLSKSPRYFYDADAIREPLAAKTFTTFGTKHRPQGNDALEMVKSDNWGSSVAERKPKLDANGEIAGSNKRTVWTIPSTPYPGAHFATFPPKLIEPCVLAGCARGGTVLDPFAGAGTTGIVALRHGRSFVGIELNAEYAELARDRIATDQRLGYRAPVKVAPVEGAASLFDGLDAAA